MERIQEQENKLGELLKDLDSPEVISLCHGTDNQEIARMILENGLQIRMKDVRYTTLAVDLCNPDTSKIFENYSIRNNARSRYIVIIQIKKGLTDFRSFKDINRIIQEADDNIPRIWDGASGDSQLYLVPPEFIKGYINVDNAEFTRNPAFDLEKQSLGPEEKFVDFEETPKRIEAVLNSIPDKSANSSDPEVW